jgi:hypothetical protein
VRVLHRRPGLDARRQEQQHPAWDLGIGRSFVREAPRNNLRTGRGNRKSPDESKDHRNEHRTSRATCDFTKVGNTARNFHATRVARDVPLQRMLVNV